MIKGRYFYIVALGILLLIIPFALSTDLLYIEKITPRPGYPINITGETVFAQNVGIGTSSPGAVLEISKNSSDPRISGIKIGNPYGGADKKYTIVASGIGGSDLPDSSFAIHDNYVGYRVVIDTSGNVGIGTTTPKNKLDIEGNAVIGATYSGASTAPANGLLVEGNVGIGTNSPAAGAKLDVLGSIASNSFTTRVESGEGIHITSPGGARFATTTTTVTGAIKITLPVSWTSTMMRMTVKVYEYSADESFTVELGGYNYGGAYWVNTFAQIIGSKSDRDFSVKFGHDGTKCAIWIGENTSTWSYPQVEVSDFYAGYSQYAVDTWNDGWSISFDANFSGDTFTLSESNNFPYSDWNKLKNIPSGIGDGIDAYIGNSGAHTSGGSLNMNNNAITNINWGGSDDGSGSGLDADLLDGHDTSYFATSASLGNYLSTSYLSGRLLTDANESDISGITAYYLQGSNEPPYGGSDYSLFTLSYSSSWSTQIAGDWRTNNYYVRNQNNGVWGSWAKLWHDANDGSGSGLDADLLDGRNSDDFVDDDGDTVYGNLVMDGNNHVTFGPNTGWSSYLRVGGNGRTVSNSDSWSSIATTNGNIHIDPGTSRATYLNYYSGTGGTNFGNGASATVASVSSAGVGTFASINTGSGAKELGDAAVTDGDTNSIPTNDQVYDFVTGYVGSGGSGDIYVNEAGDNMTGDLDMNDNELFAADFVHSNAISIADTYSNGVSNRPAGYSMYVQDDIHVGGDITGVGADVAEYFYSEGNVEAGDVVVISNDIGVKKSERAYDTKVAGIVSTDPQYLMATDREGVPIAVAGTTPVKISIENGEINYGDLLTTSTKPGHAMRCRDISLCRGAIVGKALQRATSDGVIVALVMLG